MVQEYMVLVLKSRLTSLKKAFRHATAYGFPQCTKTR